MIVYCMNTYAIYYHIIKVKLSYNLFKFNAEDGVLQPLIFGDFPFRSKIIKLVRCWVHRKAVRFFNLKNAKRKSRGRVSLLVGN